MFDIGKKIKTLRQQRGWSQGDISRMLNISVPAFSKIETDVTDINLSRLKQIADIFNVSVYEMLSTGSVPDNTNADELRIAVEKIEQQSAKISQLQEYIITLYEELHKTRQKVTNS